VSAASLRCVHWTVLIVDRKVASNERDSVGQASGVARARLVRARDCHGASLKRSISHGCRVGEVAGRLWGRGSDIWMAHQYGLGADPSQPQLRWTHGTIVLVRVTSAVEGDGVLSVRTLAGMSSIRPGPSTRRSAE